MIKIYYDNSNEILPFLKTATNFFEVRTDQLIDKTMNEIYQQIEPTIIHVRPGGGSNDLRQEIVDKLSKDHGFVNLDINQCIKGENLRGTNIGKQFEKLVVAAKVIPADMIVRMLNKIIYCGQLNQNKFILTNFPEVIDHAREFELSCA